ncbi:MAG: DegV family protein [Christensenellaceae bacterium]
MLVLFTDTDTDITPSLAREYGYEIISMPYTLDGQEIYPYESFEEFDYKTYYDKLRKGTLPKTAANSPETYVRRFEPAFAAGNDILYVHFSAAMSGTFNAMSIAVKELQEKYPDRTFSHIDTRAISIGALAPVIEIAKLHRAGKSLEEILAWAEEEISRYATYFYADDLKFFAKSGRVSNLSAFFGGMLGFHPIIYMNDEGKMLTLSKERGRNATLRKLLSYVEELAVDITQHTVYIAHCDAEPIAKRFAEMLEEKFGKLDIRYAIVNPTIGAHCGPDCMGVTFYAKHR